MSYVVGLTGGIGSGKTVVSDYFSTLGVPIIDTDIIAREVVAPGQPPLEKLVQSFGDNILFEDGSLNRAVLRKLAFSDSSKTELLNSITHPAIREETANQISLIKFQYCIVVVPLLNPKSEFTEMMQRILLVSADKEIKIDRIKVRSKLKPSEIERIMKSQLSDDKRLKFADDVVTNNSSIQNIHSQVNELHNLYESLSQTSIQ